MTIFTTLLRRKVLTCLALTFSFLSVNAQFKVNSGYDLNYSIPNTLNQILDNFNSRNPESIQTFDAFHLSNGLLFGLRYEIDFIGIEASWIYRFNDEETVLSESADNNTGIKLLGRFQTFSFGLDNQFEWFSYGGSIDYNLTRIKANIDNQKTKVSFLKDENVGATFYLGFNTSRSNQIRLSLRPFVRIQLTPVDYEELDLNLNESPTISDPTDRPLMFGLRVIFTNG